jgi:hypothetical protein
MTTLPLQFQIDNNRSTVRLWGMTQPITANTLALNINFVQWNGVTGIGQIIYNDRMPLPEQFTDPSPYQAYINQWITTSALAATNPLSLVQAQAIKNSLIGTIYGVKRQQPVNATVTAGNYNWDASDSAVARMNTLASFAYIDNVNSIISTFDSEISTFIGDYNGLRSGYTSFVSNLQTNLNTWVTALNTAEGAVGGWVAVGNMSVPSSGSTSAMSFVSIPSITVPTMKLLPYGGTSLVTVSPTDIGTIMSAVAAQNANESLVNATKQAAVNALTTIAAVTTYDATTGW